MRWWLRRHNPVVRRGSCRRGRFGRGVTGGPSYRCCPTLDRHNVTADVRHRRRFHRNGYLRSADGLSDRLRPGSREPSSRRLGVCRRAQARKVGRYSEKTGKHEARSHGNPTSCPLRKVCRHELLSPFLIKDSNVIGVSSSGAYPRRCVVPEVPKSKLLLAIFESGLAFPQGALLGRSLRCSSVPLHGKRGV